MKSWSCPKLWLEDMEDNNNLSGLDTNKVEWMDVYVVVYVNLFECVSSTFTLSFMHDMVVSGVFSGLFPPPSHVLQR